MNLTSTPLNRACAAAVALLLVAFAQIPGHALDAPLLAGHVMPSPPKIDGIVDPSEWSNVPSGSGGHDSQDGHQAPQAMQFWLAYDRSYIYFAARLADRDPRSIHAQQYQTNVDLSSDDNVTLSLDLNGSLADTNRFALNSRGATSISLAGGRAAKREWSGEFVAAGRVTDAGWEVEARIPWQVMRLPKAGVRDVRFNVSRWVPRDQRAYDYGYVGSGQSANMPVWRSVDIPRQQETRSLKLLPYGYGGYNADTHVVANSGLDLKTEVADQVTLVGTINPDFRNIENQILSLDFSRFERLPGEMRPFLLEGSQFMNSAIYASQRIERIDTGVNAYGRLSDRASFGLVDAIQFGREHDFAANVSYDPDPHDSYRVTATSLTRSGEESAAYLARYSRQEGPVNLFIRSMGSWDASAGTGQYATASVFWQKREWYAGTEYDWASPRFRAALGFLPEIDYKGMSYFTGYDRVASRGWVAEYGGNLTLLDYIHIDGAQYRRHVEANAFLALRDRVQVRIAHYAERFEGQDDRLTQASLIYPRDDVTRNVSVEYDSGLLALTPYRSISSTANYRFGKRLQTSLRYQQVRHGDYADQIIFTGSLDLGRDRAVSMRVVKSNADVNAYASFRQSGNRGTEYYLIAGDPNAARFSAGAVVKVVVPMEVILGRGARRKP